jgi:peptidoglycan/LPS O-acetylase OafA/YrhL
MCAAALPWRRAERVGNPMTARSIFLAPPGAKVPLRALTGLRFFAALHVLTYHALFTFSHEGTEKLAAGPFRSFLVSDFDVNFFFVLSGFILAYADIDLETNRMRRSARRFWRARFARIYPLHVVGISLALPLFVLGSREHHASNAAITREGVREVAIALALLQAWMPSHLFDLNGPAWALSVEAFFYACFPLIVRAMGGLRGFHLLIVGTLAWLAAIGPALLLHPNAAGGFPHDDLSAYVLFHPLARLPDFVVGIATGLFLVDRLQRRKRIFKHPDGVAAASAIAVALVLTQFDRIIPIELVRNGLIDPIWILVLLALASRGDDARGLGSGVWWTLGRASFALYVIHKPVYFWLERATHLRQAPSAGYFVAYVVFSIGLSLGLWRFLEEPLRRWIVARGASEERAVVRLP